MIYDFEEEMRIFLASLNRRDSTSQLDGIGAGPTTELVCRSGRYERHCRLTLLSSVQGLVNEQVRLIAEDVLLTSERQGLSGQYFRNITENLGKLMEVCV